MAQLRSRIAEGFSITDGGPLHRLLVRIKGAKSERWLVLQRAIAVVLITWIPLLLLAFMEGLA